jgi:hypothetical protein
MGKRYSVTIHNNASEAACFMVFQNDPTQWAPDAVSLAWLAKFSQPGPHSRTQFQWSADMGCSWAETGQLVPGVHFIASETYDCIGGRNLITLDYNGTYMLKNPTQGFDPARFYVAESAQVPTRSQVAVGITMSASTVYAVPARPQQNLTFSPRPRYFLAYGQYEEGQVIDISTVRNPLELCFPPGVYALTTTLNADGSWDQPVSLAQANQERLLLATE